MSPAPAPDAAFAHDPDRNRAWTPLVAWRRYECKQCGAKRVSQTNHTGTIPAERCLGKCRQISNPHTAREVVSPYHGPHRYLGEYQPECPHGSLMVHSCPDCVKEHQEATR